MLRSRYLAWRDEHSNRYGEEVFSRLKRYSETRYSGFSSLLRMTFDEAVNHFADGSIDLLHIDGLHTYEAVRHDFETWLPKLAPAAIVLLHDTNAREPGFGVWRLWTELKERYPEHLEFLHSSGLGVVQLPRRRGSGAAGTAGLERSSKTAGPGLFLYIRYAADTSVPEAWPVKAVAPSGHSQSDGLHVAPQIACPAPGVDSRTLIRPISEIATQRLSRIGASIRS